MADNAGDASILGLTAQIVSAHVANNNVSAHELPALINDIYRSLPGRNPRTAPAMEKKEPARPVKKAVFPDYIVCPEDGKKLKMLKRHLKTAYNISPEQYRDKWGLPPDYPMVAPNYAKHRSTLAKK